MIGRTLFVSMLAILRTTRLFELGVIGPSSLMQVSRLVLALPAYRVLDGFLVRASTDAFSSDSRCGSAFGECPSAERRTLGFG